MRQYGTTMVWLLCQIGKTDGLELECRISNKLGTIGLFYGIRITYILLAMGIPFTFGLLAIQIFNIQWCGFLVR